MTSFWGLQSTLVDANEFTIAAAQQRGRGKSIPLFHKGGKWGKGRLSYLHPGSLSMWMSKPFSPYVNEQNLILTTLQTKSLTYFL